MENLWAKYYIDELKPEYNILKTPGSLPPSAKWDEDRAYPHTYIYIYQNQITFYFD